MGSAIFGGAAALYAGLLTITLNTSVRLLPSVLRLLTIDLIVLGLYSAIALVLLYASFNFKSLDTQKKTNVQERKTEHPESYTI